MTVEAVKSAEQVEAAKKQQAESSRPSTGGGIGGLVGGAIARRARPQEAPKPRATFMTTTHEVLSVATSVADSDLAIPAGFRQDN
jgi:hypothetical protein